MSLKTSAVDNYSSTLRQFENYHWFIHNQYGCRDIDEESLKNGLNMVILIMRFPHDKFWWNIRAVSCGNFR